VMADHEHVQVLVDRVDRVRPASRTGGRRTGGGPKSHV
jgi:hypothetical protein